MNLKPRWITLEELDGESIARIALEMAPFLANEHVQNRACISLLVLEATEIFHRFHFSFDPIYWDGREYLETVRNFVGEVIGAIQKEPGWINERYSTGVENLADLLSRHPILGGA